MSYVALATDRFDAMVDFYRGRLGFEAVAEWSRPNARGIRLDLGGMRLELFDNRRQREPLPLGTPADRFHVVIEVANIEAAYRSLDIDAPPPQGTSWGARLFQVRDPDGLPVTYLEWEEAARDAPMEIRGHLVSGLGRGAGFTQLDWVRAQFRERVGIDPFPGTLNILVDDPAAQSAWDKLKRGPGIRIDNPNPGPRDCDARCFPVTIDDTVDAAIVLPEVEDYASNQIEMIAPVGLRDALGKQDGDTLVLRVT